MFTKVNTWLLFCVFYCIETTLVAWVLTMDNLNKCKAISDSYIIIWSRCTKCCMVNNCEYCCLFIMGQGAREH